MPLGALSRRQVLDNLASILTGVGSASEAVKIDVTTGPQGRAHEYFSFTSISDTPDEWRGRPGGKLGQRYRLRVTYAYRISPHAQGDSRRGALDAIDNIQRALQNDTSSSVSEMEVHWLGSDEVQSPSQEWLLYQLNIEAHALFDFAA